VRFISAWLLSLGGRAILYVIFHVSVSNSSFWAHKNTIDIFIASFESPDLVKVILVFVLNIFPWDFLCKQLCHV
jgi:hypothetical protein